MNKNEYLIKLKNIYNKIDNNFEKEIFFIICKKYNNFLKNGSSKYTTKKEIIEYLISKGLMNYSYNSTTKEKQLPDDRSVRYSVRKLMKNGIPILSSSKTKGYYIADDTEEIKQPYNENKKRALSILKMQKAYEKMISFISGQIEIEEIELNKNENLDLDL